MRALKEFGKLEAELLFEMNDVSVWHDRAGKRVLVVPPALYRSTDPCKTNAVTRLIAIRAMVQLAWLRDELLMLPAILAPHSLRRGSTQTRAQQER